MNLKSDVDINDTVTIKAVGMLGTVDAIMWSVNGLEIRVVYWNDGQRYSTWMYEGEIGIGKTEGDHEQRP